MEAKEPLVKHYLAEFRSGLRGIPEDERNDLVMEIESHIAEAMSSGHSLADVLARLGPAERLARAYAADTIMTSNRRGWPMLRSGMIVAFSAATSLPLIPLLFFLGSIFTLMGPVGTIGNLIYLFFGASPVHSMFGSLAPLPTALIGMGMSVLITLLGLGLLALLRRYIRFVIRTVRAALH